MPQPFPHSVRMQRLSVKINLLLVTLVLFGAYNYSDQRSTQLQQLQTDTEATLDRLALSLGDPL